jgi:hypothetical protein
VTVSFGEEVDGVVKAIRLERMCEDEYRAYRDAAVGGYADDKALVATK